MAGGARSRKKYYAVRFDRTLGIYTEWHEAEEETSGFPGADFCSFKLKKDAVKYLKQKKASTDSSQDDEAKNCHDSLTDKTNERPNQEVPAEIYDEFNLIDEYSYCQDLEEKLHEQEKKIASIWEYCDLIWDMIEDEKQRIYRFEELKVRMENT